MVANNLYLHINPSFSVFSKIKRAKNFRVVCLLKCPLSDLIQFLTIESRFKIMKYASCFMFLKYLYFCFNFLAMSKKVIRRLKITSKFITSQTGKLIRETSSKSLFVLKKALYKIKASGQHVRFKILC